MVILPEKYFTSPNCIDLSCISSAPLQSQLQQRSQVTIKSGMLSVTEVEMQAVHL